MFVCECGENASVPPPDDKFRCPTCKQPMKEVDLKKPTLKKKGR